MNYEILNDSTLWVAISFILFVLISFKPIINQLSGNLDKKINDLKKSIDESITLKKEAEELYKEQKAKQKDNEILIKRIQDETKKDIKKINEKLNKDIEEVMLRKINNYNLISTQLENKLKDELKNLIMDRVIQYTEVRIKNNLSHKQNMKLIENSLKNIPKQIF